MSAILKRVKLESYDDKSIEFGPDVFQFMFFANPKYYQEIHRKQTSVVVPVPYRFTTLERVVAWCTHHKDDSPDQPTLSSLDYTVPAWDQKLFEPLQNKELYDLISAAKYLDIECLYDSALRTVNSRNDHSQNFNFRKPYSKKVKFEVDAIEIKMESNTNTIKFESETVTVKLEVDENQNAENRKELQSLQFYSI